MEVGPPHCMAKGMRLPLAWRSVGRQMDQELSIAQSAATGSRPLARPEPGVKGVATTLRQVAIWQDNGMGTDAGSLRGGPTNARPVIRTTYDHPGIIIP